MSLIERGREWLRAQLRSFVLGPGVVEPADRWFGHDVSKFSPAEYGDYISTSNGVYACINQRSQYLASLPLKLLRGPKRQQVEVTRGPLYDLLRKVNPFWTMNRLITTTEMTLGLWGQAFWFLERGESGRQPPQEIYWGKPTQVRVVPHPDKYIEGFLYFPVTGAAPIVYSPEEVIWIRYPNPLDEFAPLSPLAAARVSADYATAAMQANKNLFVNGLTPGGMLYPKAGGMFTPEQAQDLEVALERRFKGVDKAHRWGVFRYEAQMQEMGVTPHDAEFLGGLDWSLEEICRAYSWPLDLVGGKRTYENRAAAEKAGWTNAVIPEARFLGSELTEYLLPLFPGQADEVAFDWSDVDVLQEGETQRWERSESQIECGAMTINEWRAAEGLSPVAWGNVWWAKAGMVPVEDAEVVRPAAPASAQDEGEPVVPPASSAETQEGAEAPTTNGKAGLRPAPTNLRGMEFGGAEHERAWLRWVRETEEQEERVQEVVRGLWKRQEDSVLDRIRAEGAEKAAEDPLDRKKWIKESRVAIRPALLRVVDAAGKAAAEELEGERAEARTTNGSANGRAWDVKNPLVLRFLERRAQRFAKEVVETTWDALRRSLLEGIDEGESIREIVERVKAVWEGWIENPVELADRLTRLQMVARTEVIGAANGGKLVSFLQSEVVVGKEWVSAYDERSRDSHLAAHGQKVGKDEDFVVGNGAGPAPGQIGLAEEDINCRCTIAPVLDM